MAEAPGSLDELHRCLDQLSGSNSGDAGTRARAALAAVRQELEALREVTAARWGPCSLQWHRRTWHGRQPPAQLHV